MAGARVLLRPRLGPRAAGPSPPRAPRPSPAALGVCGGPPFSPRNLPPGGGDFPAAPAQSAAVTPRETGPGGAPGAFKSLVPALQVRTCARCGGGNICPRAPTRRSQSGVGLVPARFPCTGPLDTPEPPPRPLPGSPKLFPGLGLQGAATSHEASQSQSLSTHTTQSCGKKNLVPSLFSRWHFPSSRIHWAPSWSRGTPPPSDTWSPEDTSSPSHLALTLPSHVQRLLPGQDLGALPLTRALAGAGRTQGRRIK